MTILVDTSGYQDARGAIDFAALKRANISGVIIKASEGASGKSPYFARDAHAAVLAGLDVEAYHFTTPDFSTAAVEANNFASVVLQAGVPISHAWDDAESGGRTGASTWADWHATFCQMVDRYLRTITGVYSAGWCSRFGSLDDARLTYRPLWVAQYNNVRPGPIFGFQNVDLWQDRSNAVYPGIIGPVDEDLVLGDFPPFSSTTGVKQMGHSLNDVILNVVTPDGTGSYDVESDGGIWPTGNAPTFDAAGWDPAKGPAPQNMVGHLAPGRSIVGFGLYTPDGTHPTGYWFLQDDGGIFPFGAAIGYGSAAGRIPAGAAVSLAVHPRGTGYVVKERDGGAWPFGPQPPAFASEA